MFLAIVEMMSMALRFTEFVKLDGKEIGLYIMQEPELLCFKILIFTSLEKVIIGFKNEEDTWCIKPLGYPPWIDRLVPGIRSTINQQLLNELNRAGVSGLG